MCSRTGRQRFARALCRAASGPFRRRQLKHMDASVLRKRQPLEPCISRAGIPLHRRRGAPAGWQRSEQPLSPACLAAASPIGHVQFEAVTRSTGHCIRSLQRRRGVAGGNGGNHVCGGAPLLRLPQPVLLPRPIFRLPRRPPLPVLCAGARGPRALRWLRDRSLQPHGLSVGRVGRQVLLPAVPASSLPGACFASCSDTSSAH